MYKYSFIDWFTGKIETDKLQKLTDNNELDPKAHLFISKFQTTMFIAFIGSLFEHRKFCFHFQCKLSLAEDELLDNEIELVSRQIDIFKKSYPDVYKNVIMGLDNRFFLSSEQLFNLFSDPSKIDFDGTTYDLSIKLKYRRWLEWYKNDRHNIKTEPAFKLPFPVKEFWEQFHKYIPLREQSEGGKEFYAAINKQLVVNHIDFTTNKLNETLKNSYKTALQEDFKEEENKNSSVKTGLTYTWLSNPNTELPKLYQRLIDAKLIHPDTTKEQFKAVFTAKPLQKIEPIKWDEGVGAKGLLAYFIDCIYPNRIHFNTDQWSVAEVCFTNSSKLAQSKQNYLSNKNKMHEGKPKNYQVIDDVLKGL